MNDHKDPHSVHDICPVCDGSEFHALPKYAQHHLVKCDRCTMVFCRVLPPAQVLNEFYSNYPYKNQISEITKSRYQEILARFEWVRNSGNIIDVGCGSGQFLLVAQERGWAAHGTEYGEDAVSDCASHGIKMTQGELDSAQHKTGTFDVVTSFEVLEHLSFPRQQIKEMIELLRPGGLLYATTPNFNSISRGIAKENWSVLNYPEHLSYFTPRTLDRLLRQLGLERVSLRSTGISQMRLKLSKGEETPLNDDPANVDEAFRAKLEHSRWLGMAKSMTNYTLTFFGKGDTIKALYRRPL